MLTRRRPACPRALRVPALGMVVGAVLAASAALTVAGAASPALADEQVHAPDATRILITGDSITQGAPFGRLSGGYSWRYFLWKRFVAAGNSSSVDFVGHKTGPGRSMTPSAQDPRRYADPDFDYDHAAVSNAELCKPTELEGGVRIDRLVQAHRPDVIVSAWGINDLRRGVQAEGLLRCYDTWLRLARSQNPDVDVVIARLPWAFAAHRNGLRFNALLGDWAAARTTARSRIVLAEMGEPYGYADLYDGVHPHEGGERKIAGMIASSLAAMGLPVLVDRPLLPGNTFRATAPAAPNLRMARARTRIIVRWTSVSRTLGYVVRCRDARGVRQRSVGPRATSLAMTASGPVGCTVRSHNASGSSRWSVRRRG